MNRYFKRSSRNSGEFYFRPLSMLYYKYSGKYRKEKLRAETIRQTLIWGAGTGLVAGLVRFLIKRGATAYAA